VSVHRIVINESNPIIIASGAATFHTHRALTGGSWTWSIDSSSQSVEAISSHFVRCVANGDRAAMAPSKMCLNVVHKLGG